MADTPTISLDLRRDLPLVRAAWKILIPALGACSYSAPCAVGVMVPSGVRAALRDHDGTAIENLVKDGLVTVPDGQLNDFCELQNAFDGGNAKAFERVVAKLEAKYAAEPASDTWTKPEAYGDLDALVAEFAR